MVYGLPIVAYDALAVCPSFYFKAGGWPSWEAASSASYTRAPITGASAVTLIRDKSAF